MLLLFKRFLRFYDILLRVVGLWFVLIAAPSSAFAQAQNPPAVLEAQFDDWTYRCVSAPSEEDAAAQSCELSQAILIEQDGEQLPLLNMAISKAADKAGKVDWALVILTPLDVHLPSDFGLSFGSRKPVLSRYRNCNAMGCWVVLPATSAVVRGMQRAIEGGAHFRLLNGQTVKVVYSLAGFTKGFAVLQSGAVPEAGVEMSE